MDFGSPRPSVLLHPDDPALRTPTLKDLLLEDEVYIPEFPPQTNLSEQPRRVAISSRRKKKVAVNNQENINPNVQKKSVSVFEFKEEENNCTSGILANNIFVIHGSFVLSKKSLKLIIKENGGRVVNKLGPEVTHLLFAGSPSAQVFRKAQELGVHIVDEYFLRLVTLH